MALPNHPLSTVFHLSSPNTIFAKQEYDFGQGNVSQSFQSKQVTPLPLSLQ